jgi:hypothetical protein
VSQFASELLDAFEQKIQTETLPIPLTVDVRSPVAAVSPSHAAAPSYERRQEHGRRRTPDLRKD